MTKLKAFENNKKYRELIERGEEILGKALREAQKGTRSEKLLERHSNDINAVKYELGELSRNMLEDARKRMQSTLRTVSPNDPVNENELIYRQNFIAQLSLYSDEQLEDYLEINNDKEFSFFELQELYKRANSIKSSEALKECMLTALDVIKFNTVEDREAIETATEEFSALNTARGTMSNGIAFVYDEEHQEYVLRDYKRLFDELIAGVEKVERESLKNRKKIS